MPEACPILGCDQVIDGYRGRSIVCYDHGKEFEYLQHDGMCGACKEPLSPEYRSENFPLCQECHALAIRFNLLKRKEPV